MIKKNDKIIMIIVLIIICSYLMLKVFTYKSEPILMDYAKNESINIINDLINNSLSYIINNNKEIIKIDKNINGDITSLSFDNKQINSILYMVNDNILHNINLLENGKYKELKIISLSNDNKVYYIPFGVVHGMSVIANLGPKIPFKMDILGNINNEISNEVKEYGINSSMVEIVLNINMQVQIILPFKSEKINVNKSVLLDSKIIQGTIPNYYGGSFSTSLK